MTYNLFRELCDNIETAIKAMWFLEGQIMNLAQEKGKELPAHKAFVLAYFRRNNVYLNSSYLLAAMGFNYPSQNIQRTVYETILKGYFFIVEPKEANSYHSALGTEQEESFLKNRSWYGHRFLVDKLFKKQTKDSFVKFYHVLCISSHAEIKGVLHEFPDYIEKTIGDRLKLILALAFGNIQMITELFYDSLDNEVKKFVKTALEEIVIILGREVPLFEPDKEKYQKNLRLKHGNFMEVL